MSIAKKISDNLKLSKLSSEENTYYSKFLDKKRVADIKRYEDIFTGELNAEGLNEEKNRTTKVRIKARRIDSLNELLKISEIIQKKTFERPFRNKEEEIQFYTKERMNKEKEFLDKPRTNEMDNDPDTLRGASNMLIWMTECNNTTISLHFADSRTLTIDGYAYPGWWILGLDGDSWFEDIPTDCWDKLYIKNEMNPSISIGYIEINHSDFCILQKWYDPYRLGSKTKFNSRLYLFRDISETKLQTMFNYQGGFLHNRNLASHAIVYYGAEEIGKIDGYKYAGHNRAWCSEFASWLLRKTGLNTPQGNIDVNDMENWFRNHGTLSTDVYSVVLSTGCYLNLWNKTHSSIFLDYVSPFPKYTNPDTQIRTIEGNAGGKVSLETRSLSDISSFGYIPY